MAWSFFTPYWFILGYTFIFLSLRSTSLSVFIIEDCSGIQLICLYQCQSAKLLKIQYLAHSLLWTQPILVCQVISFLGKANFCANRHAQLCQLCCILESNLLNVCLSLIHFSFLYFFSNSASTLEIVSVVTESDCLGKEYSRCGYCYGCYALSLGHFILRVLGYVYPLA